MAARSVTHSVTLALGNVALALSDTQTAASDPTNFVMGDQRVGATPLFIGGASIKPTTIGDVEVSGHKVLLLLRNDNAAGAGDLNVSLFDGSPVYELSIKPQQINLLTVTDLDEVIVLSSSGNCDFHYMAIQIDA
jgi:hypothetical protein|tara:strand:+ start:33 stop:437 length:405 start_codon:yes stop_codon:yes gene_type:complete